MFSACVSPGYGKVPREHHSVMINAGGLEFWSSDCLASNSALVLEEMEGFKQINFSGPISSVKTEIITVITSKICWKN